MNLQLHRGFARLGYEIKLHKIEPKLQSYNQAPACALQSSNNIQYRPPSPSINHSLPQKPPAQKPSVSYGTIALSYPLACCDCLFISSKSRSEPTTLQKPLGPQLPPVGAVLWCIVVPVRGGAGAGGV